MPRRRPSARRRHDGSIAVDLTPLTDVVFLLLAFFVVTAVFIPPEGVLDARLPETGDGPTVFVETLLEVTIGLRWVDDGAAGRCEASTANYRPESGGWSASHRFADRAPTAGAAGSAGSAVDEVWVPGGDRVDYVHPDFAAIRDYLRYRRDDLAAAGARLPLRIDFDAAVPVQMVVSLIDIASGLGIEDVAIDAGEEGP